MSHRKQNSHHTYGPEEIGRRFNYVEYAGTGHKRHYWGEANKNLGFYTSDQLEELSRRIKTEGVYDRSERYMEKGQGKFIVKASDPDAVHCCTCHNDPQRYSQGAQRCQFCTEYHRAKSTLRYSTNSTNPQQAQFDRNVEDKVIQVSLPRIKHHTSKIEDNCGACKEKKINRLMNSVSSRKTLQRSGESLVHGDMSQPRSVKIRTRKVFRL